MGDFCRCRLTNVFIFFNSFLINFQFAPFSAILLTITGKSKLSLPEVIMTIIRIWRGMTWAPGVSLELLRIALTPPGAADYPQTSVEYHLYLIKPRYTVTKPHVQGGTGLTDDLQTRCVLTAKALFTLNWPFNNIYGLFFIICLTLTILGLFKEHLN